MTLFNSATKFALMGGTAVALALSASAPANAASMVDRGIEKRVSDLEAEVRLLKNRVKALEDRKLAVPDKIVVSGNSRVKVTLYGQVNRAVRFMFANKDTQIHHLDGTGSSSRIGILARGRLFPDVTVSGLIETEYRQNPRNQINDLTDGNMPGATINLRNAEIWFTHADLGSLYLGQGSTAADAANLFTLSGTSIVWGAHLGDDAFPTFTAGTASTAPILGLALAPFTSRRQNRIMYASPRLAGFQLRVSHGEQDQFEAGVRYAGSPFGIKDIRVLGAFGYVYGPGPGSSHPLNPDAAGNSNSYGASLGALHLPTGLSINASWAYRVNHGANPVGLINQTSLYIEGGWQGRIWTMGKSFWSVGWGTYNGPTSGLVAAGVVGDNPRVVGPNVGNSAWKINTAFVQEIDAAATDIYAGYQYLDGRVGGVPLPAAHIIIVGARIKF